MKHFSKIFKMKLSYNEHHMNSLNSIACPIILYLLVLFEFASITMHYNYYDNIHPIINIVVIIIEGLVAIFILFMYALSIHSAFDSSEYYLSMQSNHLTHDKFKEYMNKIKRVDPNLYLKRSILNLDSQTGASTWKEDSHYTCTFESIDSTTYDLDTTKDYQIEFEIAVEINKEIIESKRSKLQKTSIESHDSIQWNIHNMRMYCYISNNPPLTHCLFVYSLLSIFTLNWLYRCLSKDEYKIITIKKKISSE